MSGIAIVHLLIGAGFVAFAALSRFNAPLGATGQRAGRTTATDVPFAVPSRRAMTTFFRYHLAAMTYAVALVVAYLVILLTPLSALPRHAEVPAFVAELPVPLYVALALSVFITQVPLVSDFDERLRRSLHTAARIPSEVRRFSADVRNNHEIVLVEWQHAELLKHAEGAHVDVVALNGRLGNATAPGTPLRGWARVVWLTRALELRGAGPMASFLNEFAHEHARLNERFAQLVEPVNALSRMPAAATAPRAPTAASDEPLVEWERSVQREVARLDEQLCTFACHAILACTRTGNRMQAELSELGFRRTAPCPEELDELVNEIALLFLCFVGVLFVMTFVLTPMIGRTPTATDLPPFVKMLMIAMTFCMAVVVAVVPKRWRWASAWRRRRADDAWQWRGRPWLAYVACGVAAGVLGITISTGIRAVCIGPGPALDSVPQRWGWSVLLFVVTVTTAYLADNPRAHRAAESIIHALVTALAMLATQHCLQAAGRPVPEGLELLMLLCVAAALGALTGWIVPHVYRRHLRSRGVLPAPAAAASSSAQPIRMPSADPPAAAA